MNPSRRHAEQMADPAVSRLLEAIEADLAMDEGDADGDALAAGIDPQRRDRIRDCLEQLAEYRQTAHPPADEIPQKIGRFELARELGRGGCGVVFLARDPTLGRLVALKVPRPSALLSADMKRRFINEARVAASLKHPNIVTVYEVGSASSICWIAAEYCRGPSLRDVVADRQTSVPIGEAAWIAKQLADAVAYAHSCGVVHRDLKPGNVLMSSIQSESQCGELAGPVDAITARKDDAPQPLASYIPKLTDFGLAKLLDSVSDQTLSGVQLGTPAYMAPEQVESRHDTIGPATDIYGLGGILYELLAGTPPFRGETSAELLKQVLHDEPLSLQLVRRDLPRDLQAICSRCLEKKPASRYASARDLADDLQRFLHGEPTIARPLGPLARSLKWMRRHPATTLVPCVIVAATIMLAIGAIWHIDRLSRELEINRTLREKAETRELALMRERYLNDIPLAHQAYRDGKLAQTVRMLKRYIPRSGEPDLRDFGWKYLWRCCHQEKLRLAGHTGTVSAVVLSPDETLLASASHDSTVRIWNAQTGDCLRILRGHKGNVNCAAFTLDGGFLLSGADDGTIKTWEVPSGKLMATTPTHDGDLLCMAVHPTEAWVATGGIDGVVRIWNYRTRFLIGEFQGHAKWVRGLTFAMQGTRLISTGHDGTVRGWDLFDGNEKWCTKLVLGPATCLSHHINRDYVFVSGNGGKVFAVSTETGKVVGETSVGISWVRALSNWSRLAVAGNQQSYETCRSRVPSKLVQDRRFPAHSGEIWSVCFHAGTEQLVTGGADHLIKFWDFSGDANSEFRAYDTADGVPKARVYLHRDGQVVAINHASSIEFWNSRTRQSEKVLPITGPPINDLAVSEDQTVLLTCGTGRDTEIWDAAQNKVVAKLPAWAADASKVALHPDNATIGVGGANCGVRLWNSNRGELLAELEAPSRTELYGLKFSPDGSLFVVCGSDTLGTTIYRTGDLGVIYRTADCAAWVAPVFSGDGKHIAFALRDRSILIWNLERQAEEKRLVGGQEHIEAILFTPDSKQILSLLAAGPHQLWDVEAGKLVLEMDRGASLSARFALFAEGPCLLVGGNRNSERTQVTVYSADPVSWHPRTPDSALTRPKP